MSEMSQRRMFERIQKLSFAKTEIELFLDTHPDCRRALDYYHAIIDELDALRLEYSHRFGPLCAAESSGDRWQWVDSPWPWHKDNPQNEREDG